MSSGWNITHITSHILHRHATEAAHEQWLEYNEYYITHSAQACHRGRTRAVVEMKRVINDLELAATTSNDFAIVKDGGRRTETPKGQL
jgi:hypothetical protein